MYEASASEAYKVLTPPAHPTPMLVQGGESADSQKHHHPSGELLPIQRPNTQFLPTGPQHLETYGTGSIDAINGVPKDRKTTYEQLLPQ